MPKDSPADELALECVRAYAELRRAASVLHDDVGSLLAVAGLRLQLLCMDCPDASEHAAQVTEAIGGAMEHVRQLSRALEPSPVRRSGLKNALLDLAASFPGATVRYTAAVALPPVDADAVYRAIANSVAVAARARGVTRIAISISGSRALLARVEHNGRQPGAAKELAATALLARHAGLGFEIEARHAKTRQGTIVVIQYAGRRPTGG
ncbi:MAG: histidine kinase [Acidobacteriota bacterium]|nr:histidine kinase [Acidobacteriota bacterium]